MTSSARQIPDKHYTFVELEYLWQKEALTLDECVTHMLHTLVRFEEKRTLFNFIMLPYQSNHNEIEDYEASYETLMLEAQGNKFIEAMKHDKRAMYDAISFTLKQFAELEIKFAQLELDWAMLVNKLDGGVSQLN